MAFYWHQLPLELLGWLVPIVLACVAVVHILLFKTNSRSAFGWLAFVVVFPFAGPVIYWFFGINRLWRDAQTSRPRWSDLSVLPTTGPAPSTCQRPLLRVGALVGGSKLHGGCRLEVLINGEHAFPEMLAAIGTARHEILLSTYIFDRDRTGRTFVEALADAQSRGVRVCVLLDDVGRRYSLPSVVGELRRAGVHPVLFMPLKLFPPSLSINLRNHRKLLIVDGSVGFLGGMNIGDRQLTEGKSRLRTSDLHFLVHGAIVDEMRELFRDDWKMSSGSDIGNCTEPEDLSGPAGDFAGAPCELSTDGSSACRLIADAPDERLEHLSLVIEGVVSAAQQRIVVISPYFLPGTRLIGALRSAAVRGVDVTVIVPHVSNWPVVRWALNHSVRELLSVGVKVVEQPAPFAHAKCLLIDDDYALIGSANIDARSLRLNFEVGMEVVDPLFNQQLWRYAQEILANSTQLSAKRLRERSVLIRLRDALAGMAAPWL